MDTDSITGRSLKRLDSVGQRRWFDEKRRGRDHVALAGQAVERADLHVGGHADHLVDDRAHRHIGLAPLSFHDLDRHGVAGGDGEPLRQPPRQRDALRRDLDRPQRRVMRAAQLAARRQTDDRGEIGPVPGAHPHRHDPLALGGKHARFAFEIADDPAVERMRERHHRVAALNQVELDLDHLIDGIAPEQAEHDHRHGEGDPQGCQERAQRTAGDIAQHHHAARCQQPLRPQVFQP